MRKYRYPVLIALGVLLGLTVLLVIGLSLGDDTDMEEQPVNSAPAAGAPAAA